MGALQANGQVHGGAEEAADGRVGVGGVPFSYLGGEVAF